MYLPPAIRVRAGHRATIAFGLVLALVSGCGSPAISPQPSPTATPGSSTSIASSFAPAFLPASASPTGSAPGDAIRGCAYRPGTPIASMPPEVINPPSPEPAPTSSPPPATTVDAATTRKQLASLDLLAKTVTSGYVDPNFNGKDWPAIVARYRTLVTAGLSDDDFYVAMSELVNELGDDHSSFQSPTEVQASDAELAGHNDYVGIGMSSLPIPESRKAIVILTFPGSPAEQAGLQPHDAILDIDGQPVFDARGVSTIARVRGPVGTPVTITVQRPGEPAHDLTLTRAKVDSALPVESCLIAGTRVGYLFLPDLFDDTFPTQVRDALKAMSAAGPLTGLVIDNRLNTGGASNVLEPILGFFVSGNVGSFKSRTASRPLDIKGTDVGGSQGVPLVVLVGPGTVSFGELMSGILQAQKRAVVVGQTSYGNVEVLRALSFGDGSRAWIAHETFVATGATYGPWEDTGIVPDIVAPTRWDLFTEADDPALAAALTALGVAP
jgi:carboxyl-terminal processing protease